jgi:alkylation response protein AidB-like acyl-CoA dehydrogenase
LIYYAYTDRDKGSKGLSAFVIEPKNFNGIKTSTLEKMGSHSSPTGEIFLNNTKVPKENIIGKPGDGTRILFGSLNQTRLSAVAGAVGVAQAKYFAGEAVTKCANFAMRILGAYGYSAEYPLARFYRDTPTYTMVEGSANICKWIIAQDQIGIRKADR